MQISVTTTSELSRKMTVHVPEEKIQEQVAQRLKSLAGKVKLDGFRPGKAPQSLLQKRYGPGVREEVVADLIQSSFFEAIRQEQLKPVAGPIITPETTPVGEGLKYVADFEVMPELVLYPLQHLEVDRAVSEVTEDDLENMLARLREQRKTWEEADQPAATGNRVTINFEGKVDGETFTNGKVENMPAVLGSNQFVPGFEEKLLGTVAGSSLTFALDFPEGYGGEKLSGKTGEFSVEVVKVEVGIVPELDEKFVSIFGIENGDVEAFRAEIKNSMEREMKRALGTKNKDLVLEELLKRNAVPNLPNVLVNEELKSLLKAYKNEAQRLKMPFDEASVKEGMEHMARRRVSLGLLLNKLIDTNQLKADPARVRSAIEDLSQSYEDPEEVINWYYSNQDQLAQVQTMVLEDQVVDLILETAKVQERRVSFKDLMQQSQPQEASQA